MTSSPDADGAGSSEAPFLPPPPVAGRPVGASPGHDPAVPPALPDPEVPVLPEAPALPALPASPDAPFVPPPTPATTDGPEPSTFDAKAMVESQKHYQVNPAYGALPTATEEGREAAQRLREEAQRRRRRDRMLGRAVVLILLGGFAVVGWFAYRASRDPDAAADPDGAGSRAAGGLAAAIDDARDLIGGGGDGTTTADDVATDSTTDSTTAPTTAPAPDPVMADPFTARTIDFVHRRWETAAASSPMVEYVVEYDRLGDTYRADVRSGTGTRAALGTSAGYRFAIDADGIAERAARSDASLDPAPDISLANVFRGDDVIPLEARPYALAIGRPVDTDEGTRHTYTIDTEAWRADNPATFLAWVQRWNPHPLDHPSLVDETSRSIAADGSDPTVALDTTRAHTIEDVGAPASGAAVAYVVAGHGYVAAVTIVDAAADFRVEYGLMWAHDDRPEPIDLGDRNWVSAP
jgi:hypothetical protein